jgi:hypothetical protein
MRLLSAFLTSTHRKPQSHIFRHPELNSNAFKQTERNDTRITNHAQHQDTLFMEGGHVDKTQLWT